MGKPKAGHRYRVGATEFDILKVKKRGFLSRQLITPLHPEKTLKALVKHRGEKFWVNIDPKAEAGWFGSPAFEITAEIKERQKRKKKRAR